MSTSGIRSPVASALQTPANSAPSGVRAGCGRVGCVMRSTGRKCGHAIAGILTWASMNNRLEVLRNLVTQNPNDAFTRYGLAMEYFNQGDLEKALEEFRALLAANPNYAAGYYHGGRAVYEIGAADEARGT